MVKKRQGHHRNKAPAKVDQNNNINRSRKGAKYRGRFKTIIIFVAGLCVLAAGVFAAYVHKRTDKRSTKLQLSVAASYVSGGVYGCRRTPSFVAANGLRQPVAVDTKQSRVLGPVFRELRKEGKIFTDPSWQVIGHTGSVIIDKRGDVFLFPVPAVSLDRNPPNKQNRIYRIDGTSAKMEQFIDLPGQILADHNNPFGVMGLAYDCETDSLYASSIVGSTPNKQNGTIYQVDPRSGNIISQYMGIDTIGLGVFNSVTEKRLYLGSARDSGVYSIKLSPSGKIDPKLNLRYEFAFKRVSRRHYN